LIPASQVQFSSLVLHSFQKINVLYIDIADADLLAAADKTESLIEQQLRTVP
jgi:hypothetical protein